MGCGWRLLPILIFVVACAEADGGSGGLGQAPTSTANQDNRNAIIGGSATNIAGGGGGVGGAGGSGGTASNDVSPRIALDPAAFDAIFGIDRDEATPDASTIADVGTALGADAKSEEFRTCANNMPDCTIVSE